MKATKDLLKHQREAKNTCCLHLYFYWVTRVQYVHKSENNRK